MAPPSSTTRRPSCSTDAGGERELSRPRKRWQSLVLQVKGRRRTSLEGLFGFRQIRGQELMGMLLPALGSMVQRVVSEEMEKAFRRFTTTVTPRLLVGWNQRPRYQLVFLNGLKPVYTMSKVESDEGTAIKVAIVETLANNQAEIVRSGHLSSAKVEVIVLHGHFNARNEESWAPEYFDQHIVSGREKSGQLLTGNLTLKLNGGEALLENATFTDNSSFTSTKMFRLGLRLLNTSGERILEGVTEPFRVKERRVEGDKLSGMEGVLHYLARLELRVGANNIHHTFFLAVIEKHYPPMLDDEVWRLEKIRKDGPYHQALSNEGIDSVQKFLQAYMMDEQKLIKIFCKKMAQSTWKSIIGHAMTCKFGDTLCLHEVKDQNVGLFFDAIYKLVGVKFGDCYKPIDQLDQVEKNLADSLKQVAYHNMNDLRYNYEMVNNQPVLQRFPAHQGTSTFPVLPKQLISDYAQHDLYLGNTSNTLGFASRHSRENFDTCPGTSNVEVEMTGLVQGQTSHHVQLRHEPITDSVLHYNSSHGALLPGPRITQLQIPQIEATYFDESFGNHIVQQYNGQPVIQSQQAVTGFQPSRANSFDLSCHELVQSFMAQITNGEGASPPLSPRKWIKIRAALKLAFVGRLSRGLKRGPYCAPPRPSLVPTI